MENKKIKVAFLVNSLALGGAQRLIFDIVSRLPKEIFVSTVYYLTDHQKNAPEQPTFLDSFRKAGVSVVSLDDKRRSHIAMVFHIRRLLKQYKPDVLHCHLVIAVIFGVLAGRLAGVRKIVAHEHNTIRYYGLKARILRRLAQPFITLTLCYSESVEQDFFGKTHILREPLQEVASRSYTLYNGIDARGVEAARMSVDREGKKKELGLDLKDIVISSIARLIEIKGQEFLVRALPSVIEKHSNVRTLLVGGGPRRTYLETLARELGVEKHVVFLGARPDVYEILAITDIFSLAVVYQGSYHSEAIGYGGLEAMAAGLPVVVSDYPAIHKFVQDRENGIIVRPKDSASLAQALMFLIENKNERQRIGQRAQAFIRENLSLESIVAIYKSIYKAL